MRTLFALLLLPLTSTAQDLAPVDPLQVQREQDAHPSRWRDHHWFERTPLGDASLRKYDAAHPNCIKGRPPTLRENLTRQAARGDDWAQGLLREMDAGLVDEFGYEIVPGGSVPTREQLLKEFDAELARLHKRLADWRKGE